MLFDDQFVGEIKSDPIAKVQEICLLAQEAISEGQGWTQQEYKVLLETYLLLSEIAEAHMLPFAIKPPLIPDNPELALRCSTIAVYINEVKEACESHAEQLEIERTRARLRSSLGTTFAYEFSQGDLDRVQSLINDLRTLVSSVDGLDSSHRQRLLKRLESLQSEMHKRVSDLDRFWGLVGDAGVVLGRLGDSAKPIVDRIREIADIVWRTQGRAEELPSGAKPPQIGTGSTALAAR